jgi:predicted DNA-binding transcriptional regulator YafY
LEKLVYIIVQLLLLNLSGNEKKNRIECIPVAKNDHMLAILWMLSSGSKITAKQIAEKLEINIRTVYRYINSLCASGVPIIADSGQNGGYWLMDHFIQTTLVFDLEEQKALLHATVFAKEAGAPFSEVLNRATKKLKLYSNQKQESILNQHLSGFEVINQNIIPAVRAVLEELEQSIAKEYSVEIEYRSKQEEKTRTRLIDPYGIIYWNNKWYTIGLCHLRNEIRSFRVERIVEIKQTQMMFNRPEAFSAREYFLQNIFPDPTSEKGIISLVIMGRAEALDDLCIHWFLGHHLKERTANQAVFLVDERVAYTYVPYILLSYGKSIQVIEPQSFKQKLVSVASELMEYYQTA